MLIREAQETDIGSLMNIEELCFENPWPEEAFAEEIQNGDEAIGIVVEDEGMIVGYFTGRNVLDEFHLHNIAVHPDFSRRGIGRAMLEHLDNYCLEKGHKRILLEVRVDNESATRMYQKMGYFAGGTRKDYYGPGHDAYLYTKDLEVNK